MIENLKVNLLQYKTIEKMNIKKKRNNFLLSLQAAKVYVFV